MKKYSSIALLAIGLLSCQDSLESEYLNKSENLDHTIQSVLWQQKSGEYRALCYQAYSFAKQKIKNHPLLYSGKKLAIVTDIDETIIDNSPYHGYKIKHKRDFNLEDWKSWGELKEAEALPGAVDFFNYVNSLGIEIFYVSNRFEWQKEETMDNLQAIGFPKVDQKHLFLQKETSNKSPRIEKASQGFEVLLYLGDDLSDFSNVFNVKSSEDRKQLTDKLAENFGEKFIVFPNPMFGGWESKGIFRGDYNLGYQAKIDIRKAVIQSFEKPIISKRKKIKMD